MFVTCIGSMWNVYQLCSLKLKKKKKNVNLGCLKREVCVPNDMCIRCSENYTLFVSLDGEMNWV
jgi:hypothetical protein